MARALQPPSRRSIRGRDGAGSWSLLERSTNCGASAPWPHRIDTCGAEPVSVRPPCEWLLERGVQWEFGRAASSAAKLVESTWIGSPPV